MTIIMLDTETTGFQPGPPGQGAAIVSIGAVVVTTAGPNADTFYREVNPGDAYLDDPRAAGAFGVNGFDPDDLRGAMSPLVASDEFFEWAEDVVDGEPVPVTAFNVAFDRRFLAVDTWDFETGEIEWTPCAMLAAMKPMEKARALKRRYNGDYKYPKLEKARQFFGTPENEAHHALGDAIMAAHIMVATMKHGIDVWNKWMV